MPAFSAGLSFAGLNDWTAAPPILIVPEEFGQATIVGAQESAFTRTELGLGRKEARSLGDLWQSGLREMAVYAPGDHGFTQIR